MINAMGIITVVCLFLLCFIIYSKGNKLLSSILVFPLFWLVITFFSLLKLFGVFDIDDYVYGLVLIGNVFYILGAMFVKKIKLSSKTESKFEFNRGVNNISVFLLSIALGIIFMKILLLLPTIIANGIGYARYATMYDESLRLNGLMDILELYYAKPYIRVFIIVYSIDMFASKLTIKKFTVVLVLTIISFFEDGGRTTIIYVFICLLFLYSYFQYEISKKIKRMILCFAIALVGIVLYFTIERGSNILENFYTYYCGSLVYLSKNLHNSRLFQELTFGITSTQGIFRPIFGLLNLVGISDFPLLNEANNFLMGVQNTVIYIAPDVLMNYFITCFGYFYKDFGISGVILFSMLFGVIAEYIDRKLEQLPRSTYYLAIKILVLQGILFSMSIFCFANFNFIMSYIYIIIICKANSYNLNIRIKR